MHRVFVLMSSNYQPEKHLPACLAAFKAACHVLRVSSVYETPPVGEAYRDPFLDAVIELETDLDPLPFRQTILAEIEQQFGRQRNQQPPIRIPIDLDILLWNDQSFDFGDKPWHVPDRDIVKQIHLALPLAELAPNYRHPETGQTLQAIADSLPHDTIQRRDDVILEYE